MAFLADLVRNLELIPIGLALVIMGAVFWFTTRTRTWGAVEEANLGYAGTLRARGQADVAGKVEAIYANARKRLPIYGIVFAAVGGVLIAWGALRYAL